MYNLISISLYIFIVWICVWNHSFRVDKKILNNTSKNVTLPFDRRLVVYSNILIVLLFTFYTIFYVTIYINNFTNLGTPTNTQVSFYGGIFSIAIVTIGAILMIRTRNGLSMLSSKEVIYSINKVHVSSGIYKYFHHPMYIGMLLIVIGTLVLNPSIIGSIVISFIAICLVLKARTEIKK